MLRHDKDPPAGLVSHRLLPRFDSAGVYLKEIVFVKRQGRVGRGCRFFPFGQERSTKSHETARTNSVPLRVFSWIVLLWKRHSLKIKKPPPAGVDVAWL